MKKRDIIIAVIAVIILVGLVFVFNSNELKKIGYNKEEIAYIKENLNDNEIEKLLKIDYDKNTINILKHKDYNIDKITDYLNYINEYNLNIDDSIYYINNELDYEIVKEIILLENYDQNKLVEYYNYLKDNEVDIKYLTYLVNNDIEYDENISNFMKEKYFVLNNLDRYLSYKKDNLSYEEVVRLVNSNRDRDYYTNIGKADLSKGYQVIVNKYHALDKNYVPSDLVSLDANYTDNWCKLESTTYTQFKKLVDDAKKSGINIMCRSGYRSYNDQDYIYNGYVNDNGLEWANNYSARPGHSEHQTGLAIDVVQTGHNYGEFDGSNEYNWITKNAHKYGFILRYPKGKENITGYSYESWHYRYVGVDVATAIYNEGITYEEYYEYYLK